MFALVGTMSGKAKAEALLFEAIAIAREQEVRLHELRAATDLARFWRGEKSIAERRALLEPALAQIKGGSLARDVIEARALLTSLDLIAPDGNFVEATS